MVISRTRLIANLIGGDNKLTVESLPAEATEPGTASFASTVSLPLSGNDIGQQAFVQSTNRLYIWNGSGWYNIALINTSPSSITGFDTTYLLSSDGTPTVITLNSVDPEELNLQWSYQVTSGSLTNGGGPTVTITQEGNVFTLTPTTNENYAGEFTLAFTASDGVNIASAVSVLVNTCAVLKSTSVDKAALVVNSAPNLA